MKITIPKRTILAGLKNDTRTQSRKCPIAVTVDKFLAPGYVCEATEEQISIIKDNKAYQAYLKENNPYPYFSWNPLADTVEVVAKSPMTPEVLSFMQAFDDNFGNNPQPKLQKRLETPVVVDIPLKAPFRK